MVSLREAECVTGKINLNVVSGNERVKVILKNSCTPLLHYSMYICTVLNETARQFCNTITKEQQQRCHQIKEKNEIKKEWLPHMVSPGRGGGVGGGLTQLSQGRQSAGCRRSLKRME
jgi:hypothetical protein